MSLNELFTDNISELTDIHLPYYNDIINKSFIIDNKSLDELLESLKTFSYLGIDSSYVVREIIWQIGFSQDTFDKYFVKNEDKYIVRSEIDKVIYCEFKRVFPKEHTLEELSCKFINLEIDKIAESGNLRLLKYAISKKYYYNEDTFAFACKSGNREMLEYLINIGCPYDEWAISGAAEGNHFDIVKWLREKDCPWNALACVGAVINNNFEMLKWLREKNCPWNEWVSSAARYNPVMLKWLRSMNCPCNEDMCDTIEDKKYYELSVWCQNNSNEYSELELCDD